MKINFFEEFPTKEVLKKARLIRFNSVVYIAAKSLKEFEKWAKELRKINPKITPAYWPVLKQKEGYWLSPFAERKALERVFNSLKDYKGKVLLDLELPTHAPKLFFKNLFKFFRNKKLIKNFIKEKPKDLILVTTEHAFVNGLIDGFFRFTGVHLKGVSDRIIMCYTSMARNDYWEKVMLKNIEKQKFVGLGVLAIGVLGDEPLITVHKLEKDLELAQKSGVKEVTIFRLAGLDKAYMKMINNFNSS